MKIKTRGIAIHRICTITREDETGKQEEKRFVKRLICRINNDIPPTHKNFQSVEYEV